MTKIKSVISTKGQLFFVLRSSQSNLSQKNCRNGVTVRNWTTKELLTLKRAVRRGLNLDEIAKLLPRHRVDVIISRARRERVIVSNAGSIAPDSTATTKLPAL